MTVSVEIEDRIRKCQKILQTNPNSQIFAALAEAYRKRGDLDTAFRICQNGLKIHPSYGSAHVVMAKVNLDRGLYDWAETEVLKARSIEGNSRGIELLLAEIHIYRGEFRNAIKLLKNLISSDPGNEQIRRLLDIARRLPEEQKALIGQDKPQSQKKVPAQETVTTTENILKDESGPITAAEVIRQALSISEVQGVLLINNEGLVLESKWSLSMDLTVCGATLAELDLFLTQELVKNSFGKCSTILIETARTLFYMYRLEAGSFLFVGTDKVNLGTLRMKIAALMSRYEMQ